MTDQGSQKTPSRINFLKNYIKVYHIQIAENQRQRENVERSQRKIHLTYWEIRVRIMSDFESEIMQARRKWSELFKVLKEKTQQPRILYLEKFSFKNKEGIKNF